MLTCFDMPGCFGLLCFNCVPIMINYVLDVTIMINIALNLIETDDCQYAASDLNQDGTVNVLDILDLVSLILD